MDNYEKQVYTGRELFLKYDQDKLIKKYGLKHDEEYLYLKYIGTEYRINRRNGAVEYARRRMDGLQRIYSCYDNL